MNEIETKFYEALDCKLFLMHTKVGKDHYAFTDNFDFTIEAQPRDDCFSGYIPDFAINVNNEKEGFVIEIDGHEWHEKTKEQARVDKEKDRAYLKNNYIPVRFTGYEVYHNVDRCVDDLIDILITNQNFFGFKAMLNSDLGTYERAEELNKINSEMYWTYVNPLAILVKDGKIKPRKNTIVLGE